MATNSDTPSGNSNGPDREPRERRHAAETLLPALYDELCKLAKARIASERPGMTMQATELVHEAYLRLVDRTGAASAQQWDGRGHFFAAAATAMRRILVERARARGRIKRGGELHRVALEDLAFGADHESVDILALDAALMKLAAQDQRKHDVVMLRFFAGLSIEKTALEIGVADATIERDWAYSKAWLFRELEQANS
ncbi:MAG: ECF-type sigma factor [Phycisphaerae bacterium]|nr:ECF-type sigma factor [Phycisphaerae bacterium]